MRWLIPAEGAERGDQLWLPAAWSVLAGIWLWFAPLSAATSRDRQGAVRPWGGTDLCVGLLIAGHELGGLWVCLTGGQLRVTANLMAEWWGLGCAWIIIRDLVTDAGWFTQLRRGLIATAATVALLGIYQHYWGLPQSVREMMPKFEQLRADQAQGKRSEVAWELARMGIPTSEPALTLYEKRLQDSREPFGFFALANTLGGLLAACLVWVLAWGEPAARAREKTSTGIPWLALRAPVLIGMAWCLALTKSRTAWVGTVCGALVLGYQWLRLARGPAGRGSVAIIARPAGPRAKQWHTRWLIGVVAAALIIVAGLWGLAQSGGWDWQILQEAPKSLSYRGQYWIGTLRLIAESPIFGKGLGQFREHYLRVKLPEASEEIADPHNLLLDAWVNGGILALAGLVGMAALALQSQWRPVEPPASLPTGEAFSNDFPARGVFTGGVLAFALAFAASLWLDGAWDDRYLVLAVAWCGLFWLLSPRAGEPGASATGVSATGAAAALTTLGVHLLGAGGLGMPAVTQMAFVWLASATVRQSDDRVAGDGVCAAPRSRASILGAAKTPSPATQHIFGTYKLRIPSLVRRFAAALSVLAGVAIAMFVWQPVLATQRDLASGDAAAQRGDLRSAAIAYARAATGDPWDPSADVRSAELAFDRWRRNTGNVALFDEALSHFQEAARRDPHAVDWLRREGELWLARAEQSADPSHAARAAELLGTAVARYPTNSAWLAEWSDAAFQAGDTTVAVSTARRAIVQDDLNQSLGHVERVLPAATRQRLEQRLRAMAF